MPIILYHDKEAPNNIGKNVGPLRDDQCPGAVHPICWSWRPPQNPYVVLSLRRGPWRALGLKFKVKRLLGVRV